MRLIFIKNVQNYETFSNKKTIQSSFAKNRLIYSVTIHIYLFINILNSKHIFI